MKLLKKIKQDPVESISIIILTAIFVYLNFFKGTPGDFLCFIADNVYIEIIRLIIDILYCVIITLIIFNVLNSNSIKKCYYHCFHLAYVFLPTVLIGQYIFLKNDDKVSVSFIASFIASLINSLIMAYYICKKLKQAQKIDIQYLKYSRLFVFVIFSIIFSFVSLLSEKLEVAHFLLFSFPLLMLQIMYEKIDLVRKGIKCETIQELPETEKEQKADNKEQGNTIASGNATASGTICVNLEVKI